jgi:uroporphyrinogen decarboxylase
MHSAERLLNTLSFKPVDHIPDIEFGYWDEVFTEWPPQGMPALEPTHRDFELYFGFEQLTALPVSAGLYPRFEPRVLEAKDGYEIFQDGDGVTCRRKVGGSSSIPQHLAYPLASPEDWEKIFKPRLNAADPARIGANLTQTLDALWDNNEIPVFHVGSLLGMPRNWMGFEEFCVTLASDRPFMERIIDDLTATTCQTIEAVADRLRGRVHHAHFWEDISFNAGPIVPPKFFNEVAVPRYRQITDLLRKKIGITHVSVDSDGDIRLLIDGWLDGGVNVMFPLEQNGHMDVVELRKRYGQDLGLMGGIDKVKMAQGGDVIRRDLERIAPVVAEGGFVPFCDHRCPPDVSLANYRHYVQLKREIFGIPAKAEAPRATPCGLP